MAAVRIWMVGHSIVHWASIRAKESGLGPNLGLPHHVQVSWLTRRGMLWAELLPLVRKHVRFEGPPSAIVLQLGENDLPATDCCSLRFTIQRDLVELAEFLPGVKVFWSQLLQRRTWRGSRCPAATEGARKRVNKVAMKTVIAHGGSVIAHPNITFKEAVLFRDDGVHLSPLGNDTWLNSVVLGLKVGLQL